MTSGIELTTDDVQTFADGLQGELTRPQDSNYDEARALYNAMIDKRPALIARCASTADVVSAVNFGREHGLDIAIRCGGHNGPGLGSVDDGLVIDLSGLKGVSVDPAAKTAVIGGGCLLGEVDAATHEHGLATPGGIISTTGAGGLIPRGGGTFGVIPSLTMRLHPISTVVAGPMIWSLDAAADLLRWYREFILNAPEDLNGFFAFGTVPPAPPFPEELHMRKVALIVWCWAGPEDGAADAFAEPREQAGLLLDGVQPMPLPALQSAFDELYPPSDQWYWRAHFFEEI